MIPPDLLLAAYRQGIFPMAVDARGTIGWFSPDPRALIPLDHRFHIPHGLRRVWKRRVIREGEAPAEPSRELRTSTAGSPGASPSRHRFTVTFDTEFERVMRACATERNTGNWISEEIIASYCELHRRGHAHSVEVWCSPAALPAGAATERRDYNALVGGLYGVQIGGAFFGESMFHRVTDASKVALVALVERLRRQDFALLDTQWLTPHLAQFGTYEITRAHYLRRLRAAVAMNRRF